MLLACWVASCFLLLTSLSTCREVSALYLSEDRSQECFKDKSDSGDSDITVRASGPR